MDGLDLINQLRLRLPALPILYLANTGRSTPELESELPSDVPTLPKPFSADELAAAL